MTDLTKLHLPSGLNYECVQCGRSCRQFKEVRVGPASEEKLLALDYRPLMHEEVRDTAPALVPAPSDQEIKILNRHCGTCVFQREDGLCGVHAAHGFMAKPQTCRDFPFRYIKGMDGVYVGLSFACTAVLENAGPAVADQHDELERAYPRSNSQRDGTGPVALTHRHEVSWEAYLAIEKDLASIMADGETTAGMALVAQAVYLDLLERLMREVRGDSPGRSKAINPHEKFEGGRFPADSGPIDDCQIVETIRKKYIAGDGRRELLRLAARHKAQPSIQRSFVGLMTAFRQSFHDNDRRPSRLGTVIRIFRHYLSSAARIGGVSLEPLEGRFPYSAFTRISFEETPEIRELMGRYFSHALFRKDLLLEDSVWLGQRFMLMHFALIRWYSVGQVSIEKGTAVELDHVREAIRNVELHYLFHTRFSDLFRRFPSLAMLLQSTVSKAVYAPSMVASPN